MKRYVIAVFIMAIVLSGCSWYIATEAPTPCPTYKATEAEVAPTPTCPTPIPATSVPATPVPATSVPATSVPATPVPATPTPEIPECEAMIAGKTNCECVEEYLSGTGSTTDPIIYPDWYLHDLCFAKAGQGTGAKYIIVPGPVALQMGESTGPIRMVFVPFGTTFQGWSQGGWRYISDQAMMSQWMPESVESGLWGLICGYERNLNLAVPAFRWNGTKEVRDKTLDCPLTTETPSTLAPEAPATSESPVTEAAEDWIIYPEIFKIQFNEVYYCGARMSEALYPEGARSIETWPKVVTDGNYLHDNSSSGMGNNAFCGGTAENGELWTMVLLKTDGVYPAEFPLQ